MAALLRAPRIPLGASPPAAPRLLLLLLLLPPAQAAPGAHGRPLSKVVALNVNVACGRPYIQGKIVGGVDVLERKWPWQVSVHYRGFHVCGGSIISEYWILSAAHCFDRDKNIVAFDMYVGLVDLRFASNHTQWFEVNKVIVHPTYQLYHPVGGDIALVQLKSRIVFSDSVLPVCIAPPDVNLHNVTCWATGWGLISPQGYVTDHLQEAQMPLISLPLCQLLYGHLSYIMLDMLCAGDIRNVKTVCEGDSGGPLVCELNRTWLQENHPHRDGRFTQARGLRRNADIPERTSAPSGSPGSEGFSGSPSTLLLPGHPTRSPGRGSHIHTSGMCVNTSDHPQAPNVQKPW